MFSTDSPTMVGTVYKGSAGVCSTILASISAPSSYPEILGCVVALFTLVSLSFDIRRKAQEMRDKRRNKKHTVHRSGDI